MRLTYLQRRHDQKALFFKMWNPVFIWPATPNGEWITVFGWEGECFLNWSAVWGRVPSIHLQRSVQGLQNQSCRVTDEACIRVEKWFEEFSPSETWKKVVRRERPLRFIRCLLQRSLGSPSGLSFRCESDGHCRNLLGCYVRVVSKMVSFVWRIVFRWSLASWYDSTRSTSS